MNADHMHVCMCGLVVSMEDARHNIGNPKSDRSKPPLLHSQPQQGAD